MVERWTRPGSNPVAGQATAERPVNAEDHITLKAPDLERKLEQMARGEAEPATAGASAPAESGGDDDDVVPIDAARLEESSMGIIALRDTLLTTFLADVPPRIERLAEAIESKDPRRIEFESHGLKGMCATIGAVICGRVFARIEDLAGEERVAELTPLLPRAREAVRRTEEYISRLERILSRAA